MDLGCAREVVKTIKAATGLSGRVERDGDEWVVDVDLPPVGEERARITVSDPEDWPWLYETHVRPWMDRAAGP